MIPIIAEEVQPRFTSKRFVIAEAIEAEKQKLEPRNEREYTPEYKE